MVLVLRGGPPTDDSDITISCSLLAARFLVVVVVVVVDRKLLTTIFRDTSTVQHFHKGMCILTYLKRLKLCSDPRRSGWSLFLHALPLHFHRQHQLALLHFMDIEGDLVGC